MEKMELYDTLEREVKALTTGSDGRFRFYVCGPTVYGPAHIGNFLTFVRFDVLYRTLQVAGYEPFFVRNITDVDDKTINGARAAGTSLAAFTEQWTEVFHADCAALNLLPPDVEPRATAHIEQQIAMAQQLQAGGYAYVGPDQSLYFRVRSFPEYGKLSHFDLDALMAQSTNSAGEVNLADEYEREAVSDFALWKAHKPEDGDVGWDSPWGRGRPGWHLECSAMSIAYLGTGFNLHGGGEDLIFPHHENEIAQSEAATGERFVQHWMHCVHLLVEGKKMSKSMGNFYRLSDLVEKGYHPAEIRLAMLGGHYRQQFNFTLNALDAARSALGKIESAVTRLLAVAGRQPADWADFVSARTRPAETVFVASWRALLQDLNTPAALGALHTGLKQAVAQATDAAAAEVLLRELGGVVFALGIALFARPAATDKQVAAPPEVVALAEARWSAKKARDFAGADALRAQIAAAGWQVMDRADGWSLQPAEARS